MARWEVCRIKYVHREQKGFFNEKKFGKIVAVLDTSGGEQVIDQTSEFDVSAGYDILYQERPKLVGRLLNQSWEPIGVENGMVTVLRRQVP
jgi:hypothetical protein